MDPFLGEIRLFAGNFAPRHWAFCNGQLLAIQQNTALFSLLGTMYGGNGQTTFALPDLRGRVPLHKGLGPGLSNRTQGETGGTETVTLLATQIPQHTHLLRGSSAAATAGGPGGNVLAATSVASYGPGPATAAMASQAIGSQGSTQPHENMAPTLALNYIIAMQGIFPPRN